MIRLLALLLTLLSGPAVAERVVLGLSLDEVPITVTFDGSRLLVFGAVRREAPIPPGPPLDVIVTVTGPPQAVDVRRKERVAGIWVNTASVRMQAAPSFYAVASTGPLPEVLALDEDLRYAITLPRMMSRLGTRAEAPDLDRFREALVRIRTQQARYQSLESTVTLAEETLFRTQIDLPADLVEGAYATRIFLLRNGRVVDRLETRIDVRKVGLESWLSGLAHDQPVLYGLMSVAIAVTAGWLASAAFGLLRR